MIHAHAKSSSRLPISLVFPQTSNDSEKQSKTRTEAVPPPMMSDDSPVMDSGHASMDELVPVAASAVAAATSELKRQAESVEKEIDQKAATAPSIDIPMEAFAPAPEAVPPTPLEASFPASAHAAEAARMKGEEDAPVFTDGAHVGHEY